MEMKIEEESSLKWRYFFILIWWIQENWRWKYPFSQERYHMPQWVSRFCSHILESPNFTVENLIKYLSRSSICFFPVRFSWKKFSQSNSLDIFVLVNSFERNYVPVNLSDKFAMSQWRKWWKLVSQWKKTGCMKGEVS